MRAAKAVQAAVTSKNAMSATPEVGSERSGEASGMAKTEEAVEEVVSMIEHDELRLSEMLRCYIWRFTRVHDLLDSRCRVAAVAAAVV